MTSDDLTPDQLRKISDRVRGLLGYLHRLRSRMQDNGFPLDDDLYRLVTDAEDVVHRLSVDVHYRSCGSGVGRKPRAK